MITRRSVVSKYLRCFLLMFFYLLGFELLVMSVLSSLYPEVPGLMNILELPLPSLLIWLFIQLTIAYLLCVLLSRTDSTTARHTMVFSAIIGFIIAVVQYGSFAIDTNHWHVYLVLMPLTLLKFTLAGWLFAKLQ